MSYGVGHRHSSDPTSNLGTSICHGCGPKKAKKKRERDQNKSTITFQFKHQALSLRFLKNNNHSKEARIVTIKFNEKILLLLLGEISSKRIAH